MQILPNYSARKNSCRFFTTSPFSTLISSMMACRFINASSVLIGSLATHRGFKLTHKKIIWRLHGWKHIRQSNQSARQTLQRHLRGAFLICSILTDVSDLFYQQQAYIILDRESIASPFFKPAK